jgi:cell surface protein SprA
MFVHAGRDPGVPDSGEVEIFLRFGRDGSNFYEFRERLSFEAVGGWDERNFLDIDLSALAGLQNSISSSGVEPVPGFDAYYRQPINSTQELRIFGSPSLTEIRVMYFGVKNFGLQASTGEIWLDELRLAGARKYERSGCDFGVN